MTRVCQDRFHHGLLGVVCPSAAATPRSAADGGTAIIMAASETRPATPLLNEAIDLLEHLICGPHHLRVRLEGSLSANHVHHLLGDVDVRLF